VKISISEIVSHVGRPPSIKTQKMNYSRPVRSKRDPIVLKTSRGYKLLSGENIINEAKLKGIKEIECKVKDSITDQERWEISLAEQYFSALIPPMELGKSFSRYREANKITQQELARRTGITPGTIHHYESLIKTLDPNLAEKLDAGILTFKEARSIADIESHSRQREIAQPFIDGTLSSVHVERVVGIAKSERHMTIQDIIEEVISGKRKVVDKNESVFTIPPPNQNIVPNTNLIETSILKIAGELDAIQLQDIPEYRRLKLISSLRILDSRLKSTLHYLNNKTEKTISR
jgi:DNA-binding XRE family transcriptional regulator|tara:strand:+ start:25 stop:897 length:873 start_codon:yes stop_codon:yes gene_type:complete